MDQYRQIYRRFFLALAVVMFSLHVNVSSAKEAYKKTPSVLKTPKPLFLKPPAIKAFGCQRKYLYEGKVLECDSNLSRDGENLRPILSQVPEALSELNIYQKNRRNIKYLSYLGTLGLTVMGLGLIFQSGKTGSEAVLIRNLVFFPGVMLAGGSFIYGFVFLTANEEHLVRAVDTYNDANSEKQIELRFTVELTF
ncbi:MAG: hypothetical protein HY072_02835 [Deltaproteobacteria bacterium]|nr:hypothetical protein [Deltaproteobacteria bacterium]